jgi:hypothetical protein
VTGGLAPVGPTAVGGKRPRCVPSATAELGAIRVAGLRGTPDQNPPKSSQRIKGGEGEPGRSRHVAIIYLENNNIARNCALFDELEYMRLRGGSQGHIWVGIGDVRAPLI